MRTAFLVVAVLGLGLLATSLSGFFAVHSYPGYGLPISWREELESASSGKPNVWFSWENFAYDTALWSLIFGILALIVRRRKSAFFIRN